MDGFVAIFHKLDDPRATSVRFPDLLRRSGPQALFANARHPLFEVLFAALCAALCGFKGAVDAAYFAEAKLDVLRRHAPYDHGAPSHDTFSRVFRHLDPKVFGEVFAAFMAAFSDELKDVVSIDGKTVRRSFDAASARSPLHMVSAWAADMRLVLGQVTTDAKSNEITALLDLLALKGKIVTIDAMGTQRGIAAKIVAAGADYGLALKGNQASLHSDAKLFMDDPGRAPGEPFHRTVDGDHGRIETRVATVSTDVDWLGHHAWPGLKALGRIVRTVETKANTTVETAYHILSAPLAPARYAECVRAHWGVENALHWRLDVTFREDDSRSRKDHSAANHSILRRMAVNLLSRAEGKIPMSGKMKKALLNDDYLRRVLESL